ncbi:MAG: CRISPR-associated helicase/endonuclease Cas3, partial [Candidatus Parabeggiatoa sp. nov. 1]
MQYQSYYKYWGKADKENPLLSYHLLPYHCLDVVAVADCWWQQDRALRHSLVRATHIEEEQLRAWLLFFIGLHDFGKFDVRFQLKAKNLALKLQPLFAEADEYDSRRFNHGAVGYNWFEQQCDSYGFQQQGTASDWMKAVAAHHGSAPTFEEQVDNYADISVIEHDFQARVQWVQALQTLFNLPPSNISPSLPPPPPLLAGFCSVVDWIGSHTDYFPYESEPDIPLSDYFKDRHAKQALQAFGLYRQAMPQGGMSILYPDKTPRQVQQLIDKLPIENGLTLIEAPTGAGKTEAALAYASHLLAAELADSIIFALPTQATANAMFARLQAVAPRLFPEGSQNLVLAHGKARFNQDFQKLKQAAQKTTVQNQEEALLQCSQWLANSRKRLFLGQMGVCTIDQVLLSVLPMRHHFVRAFGVQKSVLIIDEIHAYDAYMYGLLSRVLQAQSDVGGSVILLSATLPSHTKHQLFFAFSSTLSDQQALQNQSDYPLISHIGKTPQLLSFPPPNQPERIVHIAWQATDNMQPTDQLLDEVIKKAQAGAKVVVICNLVDDAQVITQRLQPLAKQHAIPVELFHARFRFCDRQQIETQVLCNYGKEAPAGGRILVATQVVEQSLDLDFDWMITQLCPVDLLFQRLGRLHRHQRDRIFSCQQPHCTVLVPKSNDYQQHQLIYGNVRVLWRTQQLLQINEVAEFPFVYRTWIEQVYQKPAWDDEPIEIQQQYEDFANQEEAKRLSAQTLAEANTLFEDTASNVTALTRDGEMNLNVIPVMRVQGERCFLDKPFSEDEWALAEEFELHTIAVPNSWQKDLPSPDDKG